MRLFPRKGLSFLLALVLLVSLFAGVGGVVYADDSSLDLAFQASVPGAAPETVNGARTYYKTDAATNDTVSVGFYLSSPQAFNLRSLECEISFDDSFFSYDSGHITHDYSGNGLTNVTTQPVFGKPGALIVQATGMSNDGQVLAFDANTLYCTFQLKLNDTTTGGSGWIRVQTARATDGDGNKVNVRHDDLLVVVGNAPVATYQVTFNPGEGADFFDSNEQRTINATTLQSDSFPRVVHSNPDDYDFDGWYLDNTRITTPYTLTQNVTLTARWSQKATVTLSAEGATFASGMERVINTHVGDTITLPSAAQVTRSGHTLLGWRAGTSATDTVFTNSYTVTGNATLYAYWDAVTYTVTFLGNGADGGSMSAQTFSGGVSGNLTANAFTRRGYDFTGWNTSADGTGTAYANSANVTPTANMTLYAQWRVKTLTVTFNANGGTGTMENQSITAGTTTALNANAFTRAGYSFNGWNTAQNAQGGTAYTDGQSVTLYDNLTLYAQWTGNTVTVTLNAGTGASIAAGTTTTFTQHVGDSLELPAADRLVRNTVDGYTFRGWSRDGTSVLANPYVIPTDAPSELTLFALWNAPNVYAVSFNGNGSTGGSMAPQNFSDNVPQTLTANAFTRRGYDFTGWNTAADGSGTPYGGGAEVTLTAPMTLYAQWTALPAVNVSYVISMPVSTAAAATLGANAPTTALPGTTITLPTATHRSYTLQGWRMGNSSEVLSAGSTVTINAPTIFTAVWGNHTHADAALTSAVATRYIHNDGTSTHIHRDTTTTTCLDCGQTVGSPVNADTNENCVGTVGNQWLSNSTQHWHYCTTEGTSFDVANHTYVNGVCTVCGYGTTTTGGTGGGEIGGTSVITRINGGTTTGTAIENPSGGTTTIVEEEVPLAGIDNLVLVTVNDPTTGATASGSRNEDGSIKITVKDASGAEVLSIPGGVRAEIHGATTGQVVVIIDPATGAILDLVEKSLVENGVAYTLLDGSVTIRIIDNAKPFDDVMPYDWFNDSVIFASSHELFNGTAERIFEPNTPMSRGMLVTVLWRLENKPNDFSENVFSDVENETWYTDPVRWATKNGIVKGYDDGTFRPSKEITREEMAAILYRYMGYLKYNVTGRNDLSAYTDASGVAQWALENVQWAVDAGIITGVTADTIQPQTTATRAQVATMFQRIVTGMVK